MMKDFINVIHGMIFIFINIHLHAELNFWLKLNSILFNLRLCAVKHSDFP